MVAASGILKPHRDTVRLGGGYSWAPITFESHYWCEGAVTNDVSYKAQVAGHKNLQFENRGSIKSKTVYPLTAIACRNQDNDIMRTKHGCHSHSGKQQSSWWLGTNTSRVRVNSLSYTRRSFHLLSGIGMQNEMVNVWRPFFHTVIFIFSPWNLNQPVLL